jgi:hypothetical protein
MLWFITYKTKTWYKNTFETLSDVGCSLIRYIFKEKITAMWRLLHVQFVLHDIIIISINYKSRIGMIIINWFKGACYNLQQMYIHPSVIKIELHCIVMCLFHVFWYLSLLWFFYDYNHKNLIKIKKIKNHDFFPALGLRQLCTNKLPLCDYNPPPQRAHWVQIFGRTQSLLLLMMSGNQK